MSLNRGEVNPLGILKMRKLCFIPPHFSKIQLDGYFDIKLLDQWLIYNLNSRYAIVRTVTINSKNMLTTVIEVGLEDPKELTMFTLGCPYLHNNKKDLF